MKNIQALILSITLIVIAGFGITACKDDDPPSKPKLSFAETEMTVAEGNADNTIEIEVVLDKPYSEDLRIDYMLGGTADDQDVVGTTNADYEVAGDHGVVEIESGQTSGVIELEIYGDGAFEEDETIEIEIFDANTDDIELTADTKATITVTNDDAMIVANFTSTTAMTVNEDNAVGFYFTEPVVENYILVPVQLDAPAPADITIEYTLEGTTFDSTFAYNYEPDGIPAQYYDYYVNGKSGELVIPAGETSANIEIALLADFVFEDDETIEITLTGSNAAQIGTSNSITINVIQQDGKVIVLEWNDPDYTDVDMDLFLWAGSDAGSLDMAAVSNFPDVSVKREVLFIPSLVSDGAFGLSHNYYAGTVEPLEFRVHFIDFADGVLEDEASEDVFEASYTLVNLNPYEETKIFPPPIVQTFGISGGNFIDITEITVPASGSRIKDRKLPSGFSRSTWRPSQRGL